MITLYTSPTPNGRKISIALEEMELPYKLHRIHMSKLEQKEPWFLKLNPNGRIPTIVDHDNNDFAVFETGAILIYLAEKSGKLLPQDSNQRSQVIQWLMWQMAGLGPMQGQAHVFYRYAEEEIPYAINRYQTETKRLYTVLNDQLNGRDYIVDDYSIADIACYPWVLRHEWAGVDIDDLPYLQQWIKRVGERPAVQRGIEIPPDEKTNDSDKIDAARKLI